MRKILLVLLISILCGCDGTGTTTATALAATDSGTATLNWNATTAYTNGSPAVPPIFYTVHYGTVTRTYTNHINVGTNTTYLLSGLADGVTYYFAVSAQDTLGTTSDYSNEVSKTISGSVLPPPPPPPPTPTVYVITAEAGTGGTVTPSGNIIISAGQNQTFTIATTARYRLSNVVVDGISKGAITSYTFYNIQADHTLYATFTPKKTGRK